MYYEFFEDLRDCECFSYFSSLICFISAFSFNSSRRVPLVITSPNFRWLRTRDVVLVIVEDGGGFWSLVYDDIIERTADDGLIWRVEVDDVLAGLNETRFGGESKSSSKYERRKSEKKGEEYGKILTVIRRVVECCSFAFVSCTTVRFGHITRLLKKINIKKIMRVVIFMPVVVSWIVIESQQWTRWSCSRTIYQKFNMYVNSK